MNKAAAVESSCLTYRAESYAQSDSEIGWWEIAPNGQAGDRYRASRRYRAGNEATAAARSRPTQAYWAGRLSTILQAGQRVTSAGDSADPLFDSVDRKVGDS
jgi:hypothetical protein